VQVRYKFQLVLPEFWEERRESSLKEAWARRMRRGIQKRSCPLDPQKRGAVEVVRKTKGDNKSQINPCAACGAATRVGEGREAKASSQARKNGVGGA